MYILHIDSRERYKKSVTLSKESVVIAVISGEDSIPVMIQKILSKNDISLKDISEVTFEEGPGSFTGLKIGSAIANTINWALGKKTISQLKYPNYGSEPNIQKPKKD